MLRETCFVLISFTNPDEKPFQQSPDFWDRIQIKSFIDSVCTGNIRADADHIQIRIKCLESSALQSGMDSRHLNLFSVLLFIDFFGHRQQAAVRVVTPGVRYSHSFSFEAIGFGQLKVRADD